MNYFIMENFIEYQYNSKDKENSIWYTNTNIYTETATGFGFVFVSLRGVGAVRPRSVRIAVRSAA